MNTEETFHVPLAPDNFIEPACFDARGEFRLPDQLGGEDCGGRSPFHGLDGLGRGSVILRAVTPATD
jgi:hypothetical protein